MVDHRVVMTGLSTPGADGRPTILARTDQEFIPALLAQLSADNGVSTVARDVAQSVENNVLKLFQPVHRTFHVALFEGACDVFGRPRLDPRKIESAGLVLRRRLVDERGRLVEPAAYEGWMESGHTLRGWVRLPNARGADLDPDPARRPRTLASGHAVIDQLLSERRNPLEAFAERVAPLFVAPPEACAASRRTILYGLVPLTSSEISETLETDVYPRNFVAEHLPFYVRDRSANLPLPRAGESLSSADADETGNALFREFVESLTQWAVEFDAFGETAEARQLSAELNSLLLPFPGGATQPAGEFLQRAFEVLVNRESPERSVGPHTAGSVTMPLHWPAMSAGQLEGLVSAVKRALDSRLAGLKGRSGRFDDPQRVYEVRGFVRVRRQDGCPPQLVWSDYSRTFKIAPWYDSGDAPPVQVALPDPTDRNFLKRQKPQVAFSVPQNLFNRLKGTKLGDLLDGKAPDGNGLALDWICGFNIPLITICAFIVLSIFLALLNIVFWWLPFVRICIPVPRRS